jgi:hypothetical protein
MPQYHVALRTWEDLEVCRHDEISAGILRMVKHPAVIPLWATFSVHTFLEIQATLGAKQNEPFHEI